MRLRVWMLKEALLPGVLRALIGVRSRNCRARISCAYSLDAFRKWLCSEDSPWGELRSVVNEGSQGWIEWEICENHDYEQEWHEWEIDREIPAFVGADERDTRVSRKIVDVCLSFRDVWACVGREAHALKRRRLGNSS